MTNITECNIIETVLKLLPKEHHLDFVKGVYGVDAEALQQPGWKFGGIENDKQLCQILKALDKSAHSEFITLFNARIEISSIIPTYVERYAVADLLDTDSCKLFDSLLEMQKGSRHYTAYVYGFFHEFMKPSSIDHGSRDYGGLVEGAGSMASSYSAS
jgi:hypothetical protein